MTDTTFSVPARLAGVQRIALAVGVGGLALLAVGYGTDHHQFYRSYLLGFVFWVSVALGSLALLMVSHLSGGGWGVVARRVFEASSRTLPFLALAFLPIAFGMSDLYQWAQPDQAATDRIIRHKAPYLNTGFFLARTVLYFVIWSAIAWTLSAWSRRQDSGHDTALRMQRLSGAGLLIYAITVFFMSVDWVMSLDAHYFSTIYGMLFMVGQGLAAGDHGIHIHAAGKCEGPAFTTAGGHFNPTGAHHGVNSTQDPHPHAGDLPNLRIGADGKGRLTFLARAVTLADGASSLLQPEGTALVIHAKADDLMSDPAGNSGDRVACGVIRK